VIQEIALAKTATIYCGRDELSWRKFSDAVSLFVEIESATHRMSEVMKKDAKRNHVPRYFGDVAYERAARLVDITSNLFRRTKLGNREPLSSLEYLVASLTGFDATQPRDVIYSLLAISRDTTPESIETENSDLFNEPVLIKLRGWARRNTSRKMFRVDYRLSVLEVFTTFLNFSIRNGQPYRALDMICRPWAPQVTWGDDKAGGMPSDNDEAKDSVANGSAKKNPDTGSVPVSTKNENDIMKMPSWIPTRDFAAVRETKHPDQEVGKRMERRNADPLVGLPDNPRSYSAAGTRAVNMSKLRIKLRPSYKSLFVEGFEIDTVKEVYEVSRSGNIPKKNWLDAVGWTSLAQNPPEEFWRTLVADRGPHARNPPTYYPRACRETFQEVTLNAIDIDGTPIDTRQLIDEGRSSIVAEFLRRVQAVIWNRRLMHTEGRTDTGPRLGLGHQDTKRGDRICILYGCTVPVLLRRHEKTPEQVDLEQEEDKKCTEKEAAEMIQRAWKRRKKDIQEIKNAEKLFQSMGIKRSKTTMEKQKRQSFLKEVTMRHVCMTFTVTRVVFVMALVLTSDSLHILLLGSQTAELLSLLKLAYLVIFSFWLLSSHQFQDVRGKNIIISKITRFAKHVVPWRYLRRLLGLSYRLPVWTYFGLAWMCIFYEICKRTLLEDLNYRSSTLFSLVSLAVLFPYGMRKKEVQKTVTVQPQYYYELIGECYVHGMMNGEALEWQNKDEIQRQVFEIR
jgi:hypothetical protein